MIKVINFLLVISLLVSSFFITNQRYNARQLYMQLNSLQNQADTLNKEYTRLQLEEGTYASGLIVSDFASKSLGLIQPDQKHIIYLR
ncbi:MAG: cell division protein FtsL [Burkholderiales bacterium]|nr:cell division protein FtsL [Burkholderiales bacterium]